MKLRIKANDFSYELKLSNQTIQTTTLIICGTILATRLLKTYNRKKGLI